MFRFFSFLPLCVWRCCRRARRLDLDRALRHHHGRAAPRDRERRRGDRGDRIVGGGHARPRSTRRFQAKQRLDRPDAILAPGLINTHTHAAMSLFRGIADDLRLQDWLEKFIFPAEAKNVTADFVRWGTRLACLEMLLVRHHHLHRHVLLRGRGGGGHEGSGHARRARARPSSASRCRTTRRRPTRSSVHRALPAALSRRSADHAGGGAARALHQLRRDAEGLRARWPTSTTRRC